MSVILTFEKEINQHVLQKYSYIL